MPAFAQVVTTITNIHFSQTSIQTVDEFTRKLGNTKLLLAGPAPVEFSNNAGEPRWTISAAYSAKGANQRDVARMISRASGAPLESVKTIRTGTYRFPAEADAA